MGPRFQKFVQEALSCLEDTGDVTIRTDYSGRGMYGKKCVGVVVSDQQEFLGNFTYELLQITNTLNDLRDLPDFFKEMKSDNMGHDVILYWERFSWDEEEEDEDDEDNDDEDFVDDEDNDDEDLEEMF